MTEDRLPHHVLEALAPFVGGEVIARVQVGDGGPVAILRGILDRVETRDDRVAYVHLDEQIQGDKVALPARHLIAVEDDPWDPLAVRFTYVNGSVTLKDMRPEARAAQYLREIDQASRCEDIQEKHGRLRILAAMLDTEVLDAEEPLRGQLDQFRLQIALILRFDLGTSDHPHHPDAPEDDSDSDSDSDG